MPLPAPPSSVLLSKRLRGSLLNWSYRPGPDTWLWLTWMLLTDCVCTAVPPPLTELPSTRTLEALCRLTASDPGAADRALLRRRTYEFVLRIVMAGPPWPLMVRPSMMYGVELVAAPL